MQIKEASLASGLPAKTIRYYESLGLISARRTANGYRHYSKADVELMQFLQRSRSLGFSLQECRELLELYRDPSRASAQVHRIATQHLAEVDAKIEQLLYLKTTLSDLIKRCPGDESPDCAILETLSNSDADNQEPHLLTNRNVTQ